MNDNDDDTYYIQCVSFIVSSSTAALPQNAPASDESCRVEDSSTVVGAVMID